MKFATDEDTIVALSTPLGNGAIAVVRLSGAESLSIINQMLTHPIKPIEVRKAIFSEIVEPNGGEVIDQVVVTYFKSPASYTGEDVVEVSTHCNPLIIDRIIQVAVQLGARPARPGEFTLRAFLNGKMDLSQAEAVAEVINARTRQSLTQSIRHLEGKLSQRIQEIKEDLLNYLSLTEISLDFSEEDIKIISREDLLSRIDKTASKIHSLIRTYEYGRLLQEGIKILILGKPNVGKSSLLNALLGKERAIVTDVPGTTRDYIEAHLELDGLPVQAVDTAGVRHTRDVVEAIGVQRTLDQLKTADLALCMFDAHMPLDADDENLRNLIEENRWAIPIILVLNKIDLGLNSSTRKTLQKTGLPVVEISARTGEGLGELKQKIKEQVVTDESLEVEEVVVTSARHRQVLEEARKALQNAREAITQQAPEEIIAVDLRMALDRLGEITGETTSEDVLNHIFSQFCIGK